MCKILIDYKMIIININDVKYYFEPLKYDKNNLKLNLVQNII